MAITLSSCQRWKVPQRIMSVWLSIMGVEWECGLVGGINRVTPQEALIPSWNPVHSPPLFSPPHSFILDPFLALLPPPPYPSPLFPILTLSFLLDPLHFHSTPYHHELFLLCSTDHYDEGFHDYHGVLWDINWWFKLTAYFDAIIPLLCNYFYFTFWYSLIQKKAKNVKKKKKKKKLKKNSLCNFFFPLFGIQHFNKSSSMMATMHYGISWLLFTCLIL